MRVAIHSPSSDAGAIIARCREVGVTDVCLYAAALPGFQKTGSPDRAYLRELVSQLSEAGISAPVAITHFGNDPGLVLDSAGRRREVDNLLCTIQALGGAGVQTALHYIDLAQSQDPADDSRYWAGLVEVHRELMAQAEGANVRLANHAIWRCLPDPLREEALRAGVTMASYRQYRPAGWRGPYLLTDAAGIVRLLDAVPSPNNGVCFCTGMYITGGDLPSLIDTFKGKIYYSQMRDIRGGRWPASEEVFLGEGEIDFANILRLLRSAGYDSLIGPEHLGNPRQPGEDLEAKAVAYLQALLSELETSTQAPGTSC